MVELGGDLLASGEVIDIYDDNGRLRSMGLMDIERIFCSAFDSGLV